MIAASIATAVVVSLQFGLTSVTIGHCVNGRPVQFQSNSMGRFVGRKFFNGIGFGFGSGILLYWLSSLGLRRAELSYFGLC